MSASGHAYGWGYLGHYLVCEAAQHNLSAAERSRLQQLTRGFTDPDGSGFRHFSEACIYADRARGKARDASRGWVAYGRFDHWHYMNVGRSVAPEQLRHCGRDCILGAIEFHQARAANASLDNGSRAEALFFLAHWVADLHQPLHVGFADDRGGNTLHLHPGSVYRAANLHSVWDSGILGLLRERSTTGALLTAVSQRMELSKHATQTQLTSPLLWARQSLRMARAPDTGYCRLDGEVCGLPDQPLLLGEAYQQVNAERVLSQLGLAARHLQGVLEAVLRE